MAASLVFSSSYPRILTAGQRADYETMTDA